MKICHAERQAGVCYEGETRVTEFFTEFHRAGEVLYRIGKVGIGLGITAYKPGQAGHDCPQIPVIKCAERSECLREQIQGYRPLPPGTKHPVHFFQRVQTWQYVSDAESHGHGGPKEASGSGRARASATRGKIRFSPVFLTLCPCRNPAWVCRCLRR